MLASVRVDLRTGALQRAESWSGRLTETELALLWDLASRPGEDVPQEYWNIGIRIEDDVVVAPTGCEVLTAQAPKLVSDIEALMREARDP